MSEKYKAKEFGELYFITITIIDWVDLLTRPVYKDVIIDSLKYCQISKGLNIHAYVVMTNHFHAIVSSEKFLLPDIIRDMKKFTSKQLIDAIERTQESRKVWMLKKFQYAASRIKRGVHYKVWQDGYHPVHLSTNWMIEQRLDYIHDNPVKAGLVYKPEDYVYSSAADYAGMKGLISLQMI